MNQHAQAMVQTQQKNVAAPKSSILQRAAINATITPVHSGILQRCTGGVECAACREKREGMQRAAVNSAPVNAIPPIVHDVLSSSGQPLDAQTREFMEPRFGHDFSQVRVHTDARAAESARAVNALAYTVGRNMVFGTGQYVPGTSEGKRLMAHELTHVVQQERVFDNSSLQGKLTIGQPDDAYEQEAELQAVRVMEGHNVDTLQIHGQSGIARLQRAIDEEKILKGSGCSVPVSSPAGPLLAQVHFNFDSDDIARGRDEISRFMISLGGDGSLSNVRVDGYASMDGPEEYNLRLSCRRAKSVKSELVRTYSIPESSIDVFAHGESSEFSDKNLAANRIVVISATPGTSPTPPGPAPAPSPAPPGPAPVPPAPTPSPETNPPWYKPWLQDFSSSPGGLNVYLIVEPDTRRPFNTDWKKDAVATATLSAVAGLAVSVVAKRLGLPFLVAAAGGAVSAFYRTYKSWQVQERISGELVQVHKWYGRYRFNILTNKTQAVDFKGRGPTEVTLVIPYYYEERIIEGEGGRVIYTHPAMEMRIPGVGISDAVPLPEYSFGTFD